MTTRVQIPSEHQLSLFIDRTQAVKYDMPSTIEQVTLITRQCSEQVRVTMYESINGDMAQACLCQSDCGLVLWITNVMTPANKFCRSYS